jgi:hypothetical protein
MTEIERRIDMLREETVRNITEDMGLTVVESYTTKDEGEGKSAYGLILVTGDDGNTYKVHIEQYK